MLKDKVILSIVLILSIVCLISLTGVFFFDYITPNKIISGGFGTVFLFCFGFLAGYVAVEIYDKR